MSDSGPAIKPKEVIDAIRSSEFLLDLEGESEKMRTGAKNLQETLNRALELLSNDLYHTKSHFILELIQNADDNSYANWLATTNGRWRM